MEFILQQHKQDAINTASAYARPKHSYGILKSFWPQRRNCCNIDRQYKNLFFSTCGPATNTNRLFYTNTEVSLTSIQEQIVVHTILKPQMTYAAKVSREAPEFL